MPSEKILEQKKAVVADLSDNIIMASYNWTDEETEEEGSEF
mgnify:CR=1 FL=1